MKRQRGSLKYTHERAADMNKGTNAQGYKHSQGGIQ